MARLRSHRITGSKTARLRVGIKWDPLERDDIGDAYGVESAEDARKELLIVARQIKTTQLMKKLWGLTGLFRAQTEKHERVLGQSLAKKKAMEKYLSQAKLPSYDLDLCCLCYDKGGKMVKFISPVSKETKDQLQKKPAFMHTGDATTGTSGVFDEEILVDLPAIDPETDAVFFISVSVNHGFHRIKGGGWSIISTKDEDTLLSVAMQTQEPHRIHVMAKLSRANDAWSLEEIAEYCPIDEDKKAPLSRRIDQMITGRYLATSQTPDAPPA